MPLPFEKFKYILRLLKKGGKQIKRSLRTTVGVLAKRRLKDLTEQAASPAKGGDAKATFANVAERWLKMATMTMKPSSADRQTGVVKSLSKFFDPLQIRKLTKTMVEDWAAERSKEVAVRTYNYERESMVRMLDYAQREGMIPENPARILKRLKVRQTKPAKEYGIRLKPNKRKHRAGRAEDGPAQSSWKQRRCRNTTRKPTSDQNKDAIEQSDPRTKWLGMQFRITSSLSDLACE